MNHTVATNTHVDIWKRRRVALLVKLVPKKLGSMEEWLVQLVEVLASRYQLSVATYGPCHPEITDRFEGVGASWHELSSIERSFGKAREWISQHGEVAHFSLFAPRSIAVVAAQTLPSVRKIFQDCHSSPLESGVPSFLSRMADYATLSGFSRVIGVSQFVADRVERRFGISAPKLEVVYNGVDIRKFHNEVPSSSARDILCVAALIKDKGVGNLIQAFARINQTEHSLRICGDGPLRPSLESLVRELGISERVQFMGMRNDVSSLLADSAIAVHPAIWGEAFGLTIVEAMAAARPVVASNVGAVPELIHDGTTGSLVEAGNVDVLASSLTTLLQNPGLRDMLGRNARAEVEARFSMDKWVTRHVQIIDELLA
ncbi:MAG: glycosyltransferase family 4 protein [Gemmatimonas sp.]|nr:glycosyltransferase family 4 protein [Gemmatimonas sp.]